MADPAPAPTGVPGAVTLLQNARSASSDALQQANSDVISARADLGDANTRKIALEAEIEQIDRALAVLADNS